MSFFKAEGRILLADIGHYESEHFFYEILIEELKDNDLEFFSF